MKIVCYKTNHQIKIETIEKDKLLRNRMVNICKTNKDCTIKEEEDDLRHKREE